MLPIKTTVAMAYSRQLLACLVVMKVPPPRTFRVSTAREEGEPWGQDGCRTPIEPALPCSSEGANDRSRAPQDRGLGCRPGTTANGPASRTCSCSGTAIARRSAGTAPGPIGSAIPSALPSERLVRAKSNDGGGAQLNAAVGLEGVGGGR